MAFGPKVRLSQTSNLRGPLHLRSRITSQQGEIYRADTFPPALHPSFLFSCALVVYYNQQHLLKHRLSYARTTAHSVAHDFDQLDLLFHGATGTIARSRLRRLRAVVLAG